MAENEENRYKELANPSSLNNSLATNLWLKKILNSSNSTYFQDIQPLKCTFRFGPDLIPNKVTLWELANDIRREDLIWIPLNVVFSAVYGHCKHSKPVINEILRTITME